MAWILIGCVALGTRVFQLSHRSLYWDDLVIPSYYRHAGFTGLFQEYDGHVMPGAIALQRWADAQAPLDFRLPAAIILLLTLSITIIYALVLPRLLPQQPRAQLLAYSALILSPFLMDAAGWWSAALNALGWQIGMGLILLSGLIFSTGVQQHTHRYQSQHTTTCCVIGIALASIATLIALSLTEKALILVPAAVFIFWLARQRLYWQLWILPGLITLIWAAVVFTHTTVEASEGSRSILPSVGQALTHGIIPSTLGGPWQWIRWAPAQAYAEPSAFLWIPALIAAITLVGWWIIPKPMRACAVLASGAFLCALWGVLNNVRTTSDSADLVTRTLHYYPEWWAWTVLVAAAATYRWPSENKNPSRRFRSGATFTRILNIALIISSTISSLTWTQAWRDDPTRDYLRTLRASLRTHPEPLLDQPVPWEILTPLVYPHNTVASITGRPAAHWTDTPEVVDGTGRIVAAGIWDASHTPLGSEPQCGFRIYAGSSRVLTLDHPLTFGTWVWEMNAVASQEGTTVSLTTPNGLESWAESKKREVTAPVSTQLQTRWVAVAGGGGFLRIQVHHPDPAAFICVGSGGIGPLLPEAHS